MEKYPLLASRSHKYIFQNLKIGHGHTLLGRKVGAASPQEVQLTAPSKDGGRGKPPRFLRGQSPRAVVQPAGLWQEQDFRRTRRDDGEVQARDKPCGSERGSRLQALAASDQLETWRSPTAPCRGHGGARFQPRHSLPDMLLPLLPIHRPQKSLSHNRSGTAGCLTLSLWPAVISPLLKAKNHTPPSLACATIRTLTSLEYVLQSMSCLNGRT